jgi:hypothetical protein
MKNIPNPFYEADIIDDIGQVLHSYLVVENGNIIYLWHNSGAKVYEVWLELYGKAEYHGELIRNRYD